jgi:hypothetical protein
MKNLILFLGEVKKYTGVSKFANSEFRGALQESKYGNKKKSGLPLQRYIGLKVQSLKCVFFKYKLKSSVVFIVIYGVDDCGK